MEFNGWGGGTNSCRIVIPEDFKLVYQGGHHDVYCNGKRHIRVGGGWTQKPIDRKDARRIGRDFKCGKWWNC